MKKITLLAAFLMATTMTIGLMATTTVAGRTIYLNAGGASLWDQAGAQFAAYTFTPGSGTFSSFMTLVPGETGIYKAFINSTDTEIIFVRLKDTASSPNWSDVWNQTGNLTLGAENNQYTIKGWEDFDGTWST